MSQPVIDWNDATITRSVQQPIFQREPDRIVEQKRKILHKQRQYAQINNQKKTYCRVCDKTIFERYVKIHQSRPCHLKRVKNL